jgi:hypothetical protein
MQHERDMKAAKENETEGGVEDYILAEGGKQSRGGREKQSSADSRRPRLVK